MAEVIGAVTNIVQLIGTVRELVNDVKDNWKHYKELRDEFEKLLRVLNVCDDQLNRFKSIFESAKDELREELKESFLTLINLRRRQLQDIYTQITYLEPNIPRSGTVHGMWKETKNYYNNSQKVVKACDTVKEISELVIDLNQLVEICHEEIKSLEEKCGDQFTPYFHTAKLENIILDMNDKSTGEGRLKQNVCPRADETDVSGSSPGNEASSSGNLGITIVEGMSGSGKSKALEGLANDEDVKDRFKDGVFLMSFGKDADEKVLKDNLCLILQQSGGEKLSKKIENTTLGEVITATVRWFKDKKTLFICDDLCSTASNPFDYLTEIKTLRGCSSIYHLVISTQCGEIASKACNKSGTVVKFKTIDVTGRRAKDVLLKYAGVSDTEFESLSDSEKSIVHEILKKCGGLYLTIAVAGGLLSKPKEDCSPPLKSKPAYSFPKAVEELSSALREKEKDLLGEVQKDYTVPLYRCFEKILKRIDEWAKTLGYGDFWSKTIPRLCVYQKNTKLSKEMMKFVWLGEPEAGKIVQKLRYYHILECEKDAELYTFHDLFHDFCIRKAGGEREVPKLHSEFLDNVAKRCGVENLGQSSTERVCGRSWWKLPDGGEVEMYVRSNLARHLKEAGKVDELEALMVRFEWTLFRFEKNEYNEMMGDLSIWVNEGKKKWREGVESRSEYVKKRQMWQAISFAWFQSQSKEELRCQVLGDLLDSREVSKFAKSYIDSVESVRTKRWLRPSQQFWEVPRGNVVRVQFRLCETLVDWEKDEAIVFGTDGEIALLDLSMLTVNLLNEDRNRHVTCVARSKIGKTVILGLWGGEIVEWDESCPQTVRRICNAGGDVRSIALCDDGRRVAFSVFNEVHLWNVEKEKELIVLDDHKDAVSCVAINGDGSRVVSGSDDGSVRVWVEGKSKGKYVFFHERVKVLGVAMNKRGNLAASCATDGIVRVWDVDNVKGSRVLRSNNRTSHIAMNGDGSWIAAASKWTVNVWNVNEKEEFNVFNCEHNNIFSVAMNEEGTRVVVGSENKIVSVWDVEKKKKSGAIQGGLRKEEEILGISGDGNRILYWSRGKAVRVWDDDKRVTLWTYPTRYNYDVHVSMCRDGSRIAIHVRNDDFVHVLNGENGQELCKLKCNIGNYGSIYKVIMIGNGDRVPVSHKEGVCVLGVGKEEIICRHGICVSPWNVATSGDGKRFATYFDDCICIWDVEMGKKLRELNSRTGRVCDVAMNEDGSRIVFEYGNIVEVWNVEKEERLCQLVTGKGVFEVIISADGSRFAILSLESTLQIYEVKDSIHGILHHNDMLFHSLKVPDCLVFFAGQQIGIGLETGRIIKFDMVE